MCNPEECLKAGGISEHWGRCFRARLWGGFLAPPKNQVTYISYFDRKPGSDIPKGKPSCPREGHSSWESECPGRMETEALSGSKPDPGLLLFACSSLIQANATKTF